MKKVLLVFTLAAVFLGGWYALSVRQYTRWCDTHLMGTLLTPLKERELDEILSQPFSYLAQGSSSKAYESADGRFVIKTFLKNRFKAKYTEYLPLIGPLIDRRKELKCKYKRILGPINAYQYIPQESGLIFYQFLKPRNYFHRSIPLTESDGSTTLLDLDRDEYIIQRKAIIVSDYLEMHLANGDLDRVKSGISKLFRLTQRCYDQDIVLPVLQFLNNFGFIDDEPIRIDVEHFRFDPTWREQGKIHLRKQLQNFRTWVVDNAPPEVVEHFDAEVEAIF